MSTLLCARAASAHSPLRFSEKDCRPEGANTLTQFAHPGQPMQKRSRPVRANTLTQFAHPAQQVQKNRGRPDRGKKPPFVNGISLVFSRPA